MIGVNLNKEDFVPLGINVFLISLYLYILIYKKIYADKYGLPLDKVHVEFQILKRKIKEDWDFPIPRISTHIPANGKPSINKAWRGFMNFIETVFDEDGKFRDIDFFTNKGKPCDWCEFKQRGLCSAWV